MSSAQALVSVITPAYNAEKFIAETIESVRAQTYAQWEHLIVIDKNSRDRTEQIVAELAKKDPRIKCVTEHVSTGCWQNRNVGLQMAKGEFVAFLDADDKFHPQKLEKQVKFMQGKPCDFSFTEYTRFSEDGQKMGRTLFVPSEVQYKELIKNNVIGCLTVMLRRNLFSKVRFQAAGWEDHSMWLELLRQGHRAFGIHEPLSFYRMVSSSRSNNKFYSASLYWGTLRQVEKLPLVTSLYYFSHYAITGLMKHGGVRGRV